MAPHLASAPNVNHLWAALLVEELVRQGVGLFVVCPGSRSTPLAVAVAENPRAEALVHWDERAAAFVALGWGRATGRPAAVITTSGTAVANLLPAAVEADADGVPLLLLTADRPPELRETGANQTVRQPPVFQDVARWSLDWPVPTTAVPARWVLSTAAHAAHRARQPPGPVHLNLPFREPLAATPDGTDAAAYLADVGRWAAGDEPSVSAGAFDRHPDHVDADEVDPDLVGRLARAERGLVVAGALADGRPAVRLAQALGWPLVPDLRSSLRLGAPDVAAPYADLALTSRRLGAVGPDAVVHLGGRLLSKRLGQYLAAARPGTYVRVGDDPDRIDPDAVTTHRLAVPVADGAAALEGAGGAGSPDWRARWAAASGAAGGVADGADGEPGIARAVSRGVPEGATLVVAASMPVRDLEAYAVASGPAARVVANRGASGIDGTVATAHGVARGTGRPVTLLVGDLALLHDLTSLALLRDGPPVTVVVVNNDGGGIFHRLPIAAGPGALAERHLRAHVRHAPRLRLRARRGPVRARLPRARLAARRRGRARRRPPVCRLGARRGADRPRRAGRAPPPAGGRRRPGRRRRAGGALGHVRPPVVLLHGFMGRGADWRAVRADLPETWDVRAPDLPGHGAAVGLGSYSMDAAADLALAGLAEPADVVGYSMGGRLALHLAATHPEAVRRVVVVSGSPGLRTDAERAARRAVDARAGRRPPGRLPGVRRGSGTGRRSGPAFPTRSASASPPTARRTTTPPGWRRRWLAWGPAPSRATGTRCQRSPSPSGPSRAPSTPSSRGWRAGWPRRPVPSRPSSSPTPATCSPPRCPAR